MEVPYAAALCQHRRYTRDTGCDRRGVALLQERYTSRSGAGNCGANGTYTWVNSPAGTMAFGDNWGWEQACRHFYLMEQQHNSAWRRCLSCD